MPTLSLARSLPSKLTSSFRPAILVAAAVSMGGLAASSAMAQITIPTVPIGNVGNVADTRVMDDGTSGYGSVAYSYNLGSTEVTNAHYAAFLTAVAATDTNYLYNTNMAGSFGGITRSGASGSYTYAPISGRSNNPVNYVNLFGAARFANWLHNGQPSGPQNSSTTEAGAYSSLDDSMTRNAGWRWAVTSENEWYKAAYHQPAAQGGDSDNYWLYPTSSNTITTAQANIANQIGNTTPAGSYAANFYGTFDMAGNVAEWTDTIFRPSEFVVRGGTFEWAGDYAGFRNSDAPGSGAIFNTLGFRVVQIPGPSSLALLGFGGVLAGRWRRN